MCAFLLASATPVKIDSFNFNSNNNNNNNANAPAEQNTTGYLKYKRIRSMITRYPTYSVKFRRLHQPSLLVARCTAVYAILSRTVVERTPPPAGMYQRAPSNGWCAISHKRNLLATIPPPPPGRFTESQYE